MGSVQRLALDTRDLDFSKPLTVALTLHGMLTTTELDDVDLVVTAVANHLGSNLGAIYHRSTDFNVVAAGNQQNTIKLYRTAGFNFQLFELQRFAFFNTVLFTTANNNCVHS